MNDKVAGTVADSSAKGPSAGAFSVFERMVAWRYLRARRKETFISVIAGFSFVGIMLGVATLIIVMAVMNGFRTELISRILGINGHIIVQPLDGPLNDYPQLQRNSAPSPGSPWLCRWSRGRPWHRAVPAPARALLCEVSVRRT